MEKINKIQEACQMLMDLEVCLKTEEILVEEAYGRILAERILAETAVPSFRKSAYDGYALCRKDLEEASAKHPVTLKVTEVIPAGSVGRFPVTGGTAARIMTGAMVPEGADTVVKHEDTWFTDEEVSFFGPAGAANIVEIGEDVKQGACLAEPGKEILAADAAVIAGQGRERVWVYRKPQIAILSTGSELLEQGQEPAGGKIYNTNRYLLGGYLQKYGMVPKNYGIVRDDIREMAERIAEALEETDMVLTTGGVSAGDFDYVQTVMEELGARQLFHRLPFKPGGAMLAAVKDGKVILGLSGNPGAAAVGMLRVGLPYMKKLCGWKESILPEAEAVLAEAFPKHSSGTRFLRGRAQIENGQLVFHLIENQKNGSVTSMMDCDLLGEIPPGCAGLPGGAKLKVYFV